MANQHVWMKILSGLLGKRCLVVVDLAVKMFLGSFVGNMKPFVF